MKSARPTSAIHRFFRIAAPLLPSLTALLCFCAVAAGQSANSAQFEIQHIHGVVVNALDDKPIGRVLVTSADRRMATMTDFEGRFSFDVRRPVLSASSASGGLLFAPSGGGNPSQTMVVFLMATRPGFLQRQSQLRISATPQTGQQSEAQETGTQDIRIRLMPEAVIYGHVSLPGDAPFIGSGNGMPVQLRRKEVQEGTAVWLPAGGTQANSHGEFRFPDLRSGDYKVMTPGRTDASIAVRTGSSSVQDQVSGLAAAYYADTADLTSSPAIHLAAGQSFEADLNPRVSTFYRVTIPVANISPGEGVGVHVGDWNDPAGFQMSFDSRTNQIEGFLPNGSYDIQVSGSGQKPSSGRGKIQVAGQPVSAAAIALLPHGQIPLFITHEHTANSGDGSNQNQPDAFGRTTSAVNVMVSLQPLTGQGPGANMRNTLGTGNQLVLDNVQEGRYRVVTRASRGYVASMTSNGVDLMRQPLVVGPGGASEPIQITVRDDSATLSGTVSGTGLAAGAQGANEVFIVTCISLQDNFAASVSPAAAIGGRFTITNIPPGEYLVLATDPTASFEPFNIEYQNPEVMRGYLSKGTVVTLSPGQKATIQVPVLPEEDN